MKAETSGPLKESKLTPRITDTAKALYVIYLGISIACAVGYHLAGMDWKDAIMHMMTTVSLSGTSAHDESFAYWDSAAIDWVAIFFMFISGFNFSLHFMAFKHRNLMVYLKDAEGQGWTLLLVFISALAIYVLWSHGIYNDFWTTVRYGVFTVVSLASTTGFSDTDFTLWPLGIPVIMLLAANIACSAGTPGGGIKMMRILIMLRHLGREMTLLLFPSAVSAVKINNTHISTPVCFSVFSFIVIWVITMLFGSLVLMLSGMPLLESFSGTVSMMTNLGMSLGKLGPSGNYAWLSQFQLLVCCFLMIAGRLEIFTLFVLFTRSFWRA